MTFGGALPDGESAAAGPQPLPPRCQTVRGNALEIACQPPPPALQLHRLRDDPGNEQAKGRLGEALVYLAKSQLGSGQFGEAKATAMEAIRIYENVVSKGTLAPVHRSGPAEARLVLADIWRASGDVFASCAESRLGLAAYRALGTDHRLKVYRKIIEVAAQAVSECDNLTARRGNPTARKSADTAPPAQTLQTRP